MAGMPPVGGSNMGVANSNPYRYAAGQYDTKDRPLTEIRQ